MPGRSGSKSSTWKSGAGAAERCTGAERITQGLERALHRLGVLAFDAPPAPAEPAVHISATEAVLIRVGGIFVPTLRDDKVGTSVPIGTEMGKVLDLHSLAEVQLFTAPYEQTAMLLLRPQICTVEGSALVYHRKAGVGFLSTITSQRQMAPHLEEHLDVGTLVYP